MLALLNRDIKRMEHVTADCAKTGQVKRDTFELLKRLIYLVEEKPVVTRFFLFAPCCFALLRMMLLDLPPDLCSAGTLKPEAESAKRLKSVRRFYEDPASAVSVRQACLCLRLTLFATSLTSQKALDCHWGLRTCMRSDNRTYL